MTQSDRWSKDVCIGIKAPHGHRGRVPNRSQPHPHWARSQLQYNHRNECVTARFEAAAFGTRFVQRLQTADSVRRKYALTRNMDIVLVPSSFGEGSGSLALAYFAVYQPECDGQAKVQALQDWLLAKASV